MNLPKYILNKIEDCKILKVPADGTVLPGFNNETYRIIVKETKISKQNEAAKKVEVTKAEKFAQKIVEWALCNQSDALLGAEDYFFKKDRNKGDEIFTESSCILFGVRGPAGDLLEEEIENHREKKISCQERSLINFFYEENKILCEAEKLIAYSRSDHDEYRWWTTWFDGPRKEMKNKDLIEEIEHVTVQIKNLFPNGVRDISKFLYQNPNCKVGEDSANLFYIGKQADYWMRLIARQGDYNIYCKGFVK